MTHSQSGRRRSVIAVGLLLALFGASHPGIQAAETAEPSGGISALASLTPADAGLALEIDQLGDYAARFMGGPLFQRLAGFPPLARWVGQNGTRLARFRGEFQRRFNAAPEKAWSGIFGGRALFAVWPPAPDSQNGPALLLVEARDRELLEAAVERIVALQRDSAGSQKSFSLSTGGQEYTVHVVGSQEKREQLFLATVGTLGIAANREELIRRVLALHASESHQEDAPRCLAELPGYLAANLRVSPEAAVRLFINPRPWDQGLWADWKRKPAESHDAHVQKAVIDTWCATDYVIAGLQLDGARATLETYAAWKAEALPQAVRDAAESFGGTAEFAAKIPQDALAAVAGRVDLGRLVWRFGLPAARAAASSNNESGLSPWQPDWLLPAALAQGIGPNFGACLAPCTPDGSAADGALQLPLQWTAALATGPLEPGDRRPPLAELAEPVLHSALTAAQAASDSNAAFAVKSLKLGDTRMTSVVGLPLVADRRFTFAYAVENGRFWLGSSPLAIRRSLDLAVEDSLASPRQLQTLKQPSQLLYLNLRGLRETLRAYPAVVEFLAAAKGLDRGVAQRRFQEALALGELADVAVLAFRLDESGPAFSLSISAEVPASPSMEAPDAR
ncbi:MAG TPA: hypothetical protein VHC19_28545 [Pirellulales bacterium]|nr:hypothetical protein [Pirellulales bacterium]